MYSKPELAGFSRCETMGPCSIPNSKCRQEYPLPLQAQDSQEAGRRLAHKHKRQIFRQKTLTASRRQVTGEQALPRLDSSEVAA